MRARDCADAGLLGYTDPLCRNRPNQSEALGLRRACKAKQVAIEFATNLEQVLASRLEVAIQQLDLRSLQRSC